MASAHQRREMELQDRARNRLAEMDSVVSRSVCIVEVIACMYEKWNLV